MPTHIRLLLIEDNQDDAELLLRHLRQSEVELTAVRRVETAADMREALAQQPWDVIVADYALPRFDAIAALGVLHRLEIDLPFIIVSGTIGEETAVAAMQAGAHDYVMKDRLARLVPAVEREIRECANRRERRRHEKALQVAHEQIRWLLESSPAMLYSARITDFGITFVSPNVRALIGYEPEQFHADPGFATTLIHPDDAPARLAALPGILETGGSHLRYRCRHKDGSYRWLEDKPRIVRDGGGRPVAIVGALVDVTAQHELEEQLRQSQKLEAIGQLAGGVAHDFNNLLTVIGGFSEQLVEQLPIGSPLRSSADAICHAARRGATLTARLLAFSRRQMIEPAVLDVHRMVAGIEVLLRRVIGEHITLGITCDPEPLRIKADAGQLEQLFLNLAVNARDAMPEGGRLTITTGGVHMAQDNKYDLPAGNYVTLEVGDTGPGIDPGILPKIFEPFFTTKPIGRGTGLGLSMVYGVVKQGGGHVTVTNRPAGGATFTILLPRVFDEPDAAMADERAVTRIAGNETILVVEDEDEVREFLVTVLRNKGYRVLEARHGVEALAVCASVPDCIHMLVTDTVMPEMGGPELAQRLAPLRPGLKVLYISGYAEVGVLTVGLAQSGSAFLAKPFSSQALLTALRQVLDHPMP